MATASTTPNFFKVGFNAGLGLQGAWLNGGFAPFSTWLTPTLTSSALLFNNIAAMTTLTPLTFNVAFTAQSVAAQSAMTASMMNLSALSIFGTTAALATTMPFTSIAFPIIPTFGLGAAFNNPAIPGLL